MRVVAQKKIRDATTFLKPYFTMLARLCSSNSCYTETIIRVEVVPRFEPRFLAVNICISGPFFFFVVDDSGIVGAIDAV
jgi:hypothetical protein